MVTARRPDVVRISIGVSVCVCVWLVGAMVARAGATSAAADEGLVTTMPANLRVPATLRPILEEALRRSPTFRHQVLELRRAPHVKMAISYGNLSTWHLLRAESTVSRYEWGALDVETRLYT